MVLFADKTRLGGHDPRVAFGLSGGVVCSLDLVESGTRESGCQSRLIIGHYNVSYKMYEDEMDIRMIW